MNPKRRCARRRRVGETNPSHGGDEHFGETNLSGGRGGFGETNLTASSWHFRSDSEDGLVPAFGVFKSTVPTGS